MTLKSNFEKLAHYNQWMNIGLYDAASKLSVSELAENRGAFFGSIIGTLNHILVGDIIWLKRFADHPSQLSSLSSIQSLDSPETLDIILYFDFKDLLSVRIEMDNVILEFTRQLDHELLSSSLAYSNTQGKLFNKNFGLLIQHFFNHQTHHRGQVSTLLNQAGIAVGVTDFLLSIPED